MTKLETAEKPAKAKFAIEKRWTPAITEAGYTPVALSFIRHYSTLKPTPMTFREAMLVIHLMEYKWGKSMPFPGLKLLGRRMGIHARQVQRIVKSLEDKKLIVRNLRVSQTTLYDLSPLFAAIEARIIEEKATKKAKKRPAEDDESEPEEENTTKPTKPTAERKPTK